MSHTTNKNRRWNIIYKIGGAAALSAVLVGLVEMAITFLPGGNTVQETVADWFTLFQNNGFMGLRDLGLLNIFLTFLLVPIYFALYATFRDDPDQPYAALATITALLGAVVFLATNRAFPMLALSQQYAAATSETQRAVLEAAGQSMLSVGQSHTPGTFLGFLLTETAGIAISLVMLRSNLFNKATAYAGICGFGFLLVYECVGSFATGLTPLTLIVVMLGGLSSMAWYILIARRLFQLSQSPVA